MKKVLSLILLMLFAFSQKSYSMGRGQVRKRDQIIRNILSDLHPKEDITKLFAWLKSSVLSNSESLHEESFQEEPVFDWLENGAFNKLYKYLEDHENIDIYNQEDNNLFECVILKIFTLNELNEEFNKYREFLKALLKKSDLGFLSDAYDLLYEQIEKIESNGESPMDSSLLKLIEQDILPDLIKFNSDNEEALNNFLVIASRRGYTNIVKQINEIVNNDSFELYITHSNYDSSSSESIHRFNSQKIENLGARLDAAEDTEDIFSVIDEILSPADSVNSESSLPNTSREEQDISGEEQAEELADEELVFEWLQKENFQEITKHIEQSRNINIQNSEGLSFFHAFILATCLSAKKNNDHLNNYLSLLKILLEKIDNDQIYNLYYIFNKIIREELGIIQDSTNDTDYIILHNFRKINERLINCLIEIWDNSNNTEQFKIFLLFNSIKLNNIKIIKKLTEECRVSPNSKLYNLSAMKYAAAHKRKYIAKYLKQEIRKLKKVRKLR